MLFVVLALLSALLVRMMVSVGTLDMPVDRSSHSVPTPKGGGIGIVAAFAAGTLWLAVGQGSLGALLPTVAAAVALALICFLDDKYDWPFAVKLLAQLAAALAVMACGHAVRGVAIPGEQWLTLGAIGLPLTLCWYIFVTNAVNFIDGLNGLAAGCALVGALLAAAMPSAASTPAYALAAGISGFLPFNFPRARIFMGDVGSQVCGFLLADFAVMASTGARISLVVPLALAPILADVVFTLLRRLRAGDVVTQAHRGHLYQVAQRSGMPAWLVSCLYWMFSAWGGLCGLAAGHAAAGHVASGWAMSGWAAPVAVAAAFLPLAPWGLWVRRNAKRAGLTRW